MTHSKIKRKTTPQNGHPYLFLANIKILHRMNDSSEEEKNIPLILFRIKYDNDLHLRLNNYNFSISQFPIRTLIIFHFFPLQIYLNEMLSPCENVKLMNEKPADFTKIEFEQKL